MCRRELRVDENPAVEVSRMPLRVVNRLNTSLATWRHRLPVKFRRDAAARGRDSRNDERRGAYIAPYECADGRHRLLGHRAEVEAFHIESHRLMPCDPTGVYHTVDACAHHVRRLRI